MIYLVVNAKIINIVIFIITTIIHIIQIIIPQKGSQVALVRWW